MSVPHDIMDLVTTHLVGRDAELEALTSMLGIRASADERSFVLLGGDAGVGKTRLLTELRDRALGDSWQVTAGHCLDFADSALPYLPFSEIVGRLAIDHPTVVEEVAAEHPALLRLQPGRRMFVRSGDGDDAATERAELFSAVHSLLEVASARSALLVVVEDLHWADHSTRDLLSFLFTRGFTGPVALVASFRSDDIHRRHPLRRQAAEWTRLRSVERLQLEPLAAGDVRALIEQLHPDALAEGDVSDIVDRAEGNAFFVEELVGASQICVGRLPENLADLLLVRLERLGDDAERVVRAASAAGRRVSHQLLREVAGLPDDALDGALREAVERHVLVPSRGDFYEFRHALLAEAVSDDLLPGERVALHAAYSRALRGGQALGTAAELARHARLAKDFATALDASLSAGEEARGVGGAEEAAQHYLQALDLLTSITPPDDFDLSQLITRTADALTAAGHPGKAVAVVREQLAMLPADTSDLTRGQVLSALAGALALTETEVDPAEFSAQAVALVPPDAGPARARVLAVHARMLGRHDDVEGAREAGTAALEVANRFDMPRLASDVYTTLVNLDGGDTDHVVQALEEAADRARAAGASAAELRALHLLAYHHHDRGDYEPALAAYCRTIDRAREVGTPWSPYAGESRWDQTQILYLLGRWDEALDLTDVTGEEPPPIQSGLLGSIRALVLASRGDPRALELTTKLRPLWPQEGLIAITAGYAELLRDELAADQASALATYAELMAVLGRTWHVHFSAKVRLVALTLAALASAAVTRSTSERQGDSATVESLADEARAVIERRLSGGGEWGAEGQAWASRVESELLRWRWLAEQDPPTRDELVESWRETLAAFEELGAPFETARVQARLSEILRTLGDTAGARELGDAARATAHQLGAQPVLDLVVEAGSRPTRASASGSGALTPREREILALVAQGRSNGEIGHQLFIATKTVSVHVSNILGKLNASSRTEAAALARRDGLLD